jgi:epoxide hydrolase 4
MAPPLTKRLPPHVVELVTPAHKLEQKKAALADAGPFGVVGALLVVAMALPVWLVLVVETLARAWRQGSLYAALAPPSDPDALADARAPWPFPVREFSVAVEGGRVRLGCVELLASSEPQGGADAKGKAAAAAKGKASIHDNGHDDRPLALFLHGFPEHPFSWRHTMPAVAAKGYRCVALAQRGYHGSDAPEGVKNYALRRLADDVRDAAEALLASSSRGNKRVTLIAHDWGGSVAWAAAALHGVQRSGGLVERMVVMALPPIALYGSNLTPRQCAASAYVLRFQFPWLPEATLVQDNAAVVGHVFTHAPIGCVSLEAEAEAAAAAGKTGASGGGSGSSSSAPPAGPAGAAGECSSSAAAPSPPALLRMADADVAVFRHAFSQPGRATAALNYYRALLRMVLAPQASRLLFGMWRDYRDDALWEALREPLERVPVLLLHGDSDVALGTNLTDGWEAVCAHPESRAYLLGRCSHWIPQDRPRAVAELLGGWLPRAGAAE